MKISARNQLKGTVTEVKLGVVTAEVVLQLEGGQQITSVITVDAAQSLDLKSGDQVVAIIKATEVMIGKD